VKCPKIQKLFLTEAILKTENMQFILSLFSDTGCFALFKCLLLSCCVFSEIYKLSAEDIVFQASPLTFDPSVVEIFTTLSVGATLLTVPDTARMRPRDLAHCLTERNRVTVIQVNIIAVY
jgi:hypothetical protein